MTTYTKPQVIVKNNKVILTPAKANIHSVIIPYINKSKVALHRGNTEKRYSLNVTGTFTAYTNLRIRNIKHALQSPFSFPLTEDQIIDEAMRLAMDSLHCVKSAMRTSVQSMLEEIEKSYGYQEDDC